MIRRHFFSKIGDTVVTILLFCIVAFGLVPSTCHNCHDFCFTLFVTIFALLHPVLLLPLATISRYFFSKIGDIDSILLRSLFCYFALLHLVQGLPLVTSFVTIFVTIFALLHLVLLLPLVTIGLHRCALVTNYSGEAGGGRLSATQHCGHSNTNTTLWSKTQTQHYPGEAHCNTTPWLLKLKHKHTQWSLKHKCNKIRRTFIIQYSFLWILFTKQCFMSTRVFVAHGPLDPRVDFVLRAFCYAASHNLLWARLNAEISGHFTNAHRGFSSFQQLFVCLTFVGTIKCWGKLCSKFNLIDRVNFVS